MLALRSDVTDNFRQRHVAITRDFFQRIPELILRLTLVLWPARTIERLTTGDFTGSPPVVASWYRNAEQHGKRAPSNEGI